MLSAGPTYKSMKIKGDEIVLKFDYVGGQMMSPNGDSLKGFSIAGADKKFVWADARLIKKGSKIIVSSTEVKEPVAVRYGWANNPECNLFNSNDSFRRCYPFFMYFKVLPPDAHLPASPFRTDDFPMITRDKM